MEGEAKFIRIIKGTNFDYFSENGKKTFFEKEFSDKFKDIESEIKYFLRLNMYNNKNVLSKNSGF